MRNLALQCSEHLLNALMSISTPYHISCCTTTSFALHLAVATQHQGSMPVDVGTVAQLAAPVVGF